MYSCLVCIQILARNVLISNHGINNRDVYQTPFAKDFSKSALEIPLRNHETVKFCLNSTDGESQVEQMIRFSGGNGQGGAGNVGAGLGVAATWVAGMGGAGTGRAGMIIKAS